MPRLARRLADPSFDLIVVHAPGLPPVGRPRGDPRPVPAQHPQRHASAMAGLCRGVAARRARRAPRHHRSGGCDDHRQRQRISARPLLALFQARAPDRPLGGVRRNHALARADAAVSCKAAPSRPHCQAAADFSRRALGLAERLAASPPPEEEKTIDVFFAGRIRNSSTVRERGFDELFRCATTAMRSMCANRQSASRNTLRDAREPISCGRRKATVGSAFVPTRPRLRRRAVVQPARYRTLPAAHGRRPRRLLRCRTRRIEPCQRGRRSPIGTGCAPSAMRRAGTCSPFIRLPRSHDISSRPPWRRQDAVAPRDPHGPTVMGDSCPCMIIAAPCREPDRRHRRALVFDITTSALWTGPPAGIVRVEREFGRWGLAHLDAFTPAFFDPEVRASGMSSREVAGRLISQDAAIDTLSFVNPARRGKRKTDRIPKALRPASLWILQSRAQDAPGYGAHPSRNQNTPACGLGRYSAAPADEFEASCRDGQA